MKRIWILALMACSLFAEPAGNQDSIDIAAAYVVKGGALLSAAGLGEEGTYLQIFAVNISLGCRMKCSTTLDDKTGQMISTCSSAYPAKAKK